MTFRLSYSDPDAAFHPLAKVRVLHVCLRNFIICFSCATKVLGYVPHRHERKNIGSNAVSKWGFFVLNATNVT